MERPPFALTKTLKSIIVFWPFDFGVEFFKCEGILYMYMFALSVRIPSEKEKNDPLSAGR